MNARAIRKDNEPEFQSGHAARWYKIGWGSVTVKTKSSLMAVIAITLTATASNAGSFDVYRVSCLDNDVDLSRIRTAAKSWSALSEAEREQLAPGNPAAVEGWANISGGSRYLVNISNSAAGGMAGERSGAPVISCSVLAPKPDEAEALKAYSAFLKRPPSTTDKSDGYATYTWSIQSSSEMSLHYLVSGGTLPGVSLSVSSIRK